MANDSLQERDQPATKKRLKHAQHQGQIPRSKEFSRLMLLLTTGITLMGSMATIYHAFAMMMRDFFTVPINHIDQTGYLYQLLHTNIQSIFSALLPFFCIAFLTAVCSPLMIGGLLFSSKTMAPNLARISFYTGIKRIFSLKTLAESVKTTLKILMISLGVLLFIPYCYHRIVELYRLNINDMLITSKQLMIASCIVIWLALLILTLADISYQLWCYKRRLKMTLQETKDEIKEAEMSSESKKRLRTRQYSQSSWIRELSKADLILTQNCSFAIALRYQPKVDLAPILIAKGRDYQAQQLTMLAKRYMLMIFEHPSLAQEIYFSTQINTPIPSKFYANIAPLLAHANPLKYSTHLLKKATPLPISQG